MRTVIVEIGLPFSSNTTNVTTETMSGVAGDANVAMTFTDEPELGTMVTAGAISGGRMLDAAPGRAGTTGSSSTAVDSSRVDEPAGLVVGAADGVGPDSGSVVLGVKFTEFEFDD